jgi:hypothetical protein
VEHGGGVRNTVCNIFMFVKIRLKVKTTAIFLHVTSLWQSVESCNVPNLMPMFTNGGKIKDE